MSLHLVFSDQGLVQCEKLLQADDILVFIGDGVGCHHRGHKGLSYVIREDLAERGLELSGEQIAAGYTLVDYSELVALCVAQTPSVSWA